MEPRTLSRDFAATGQLEPSDVPVVKAMGFRAILCHRHDDEDPWQPLFEEIQAVAVRNGLVARYLPVPRGEPGPDDVGRFRAALSALPKPVLGYSLHGRRPEALWAALEAPDAPPAA